MGCNGAIFRSDGDSDYSAYHLGIRKTSSIWQTYGVCHKTITLWEEGEWCAPNGSVDMKSVPRKPASEEMLTNIKKHLKDYVAVGSASSPTRLPQFENLFPDSVRAAGDSTIRGL